MQTRLRELRKNSGVTQTWMARKLKIHRLTYLNYEMGKSTPSESTLFHAAHLLHVSPEQLIDAADR